MMSILAVSCVYVVAVVICSGVTVVVNVTLEREDEIAGPILAPFFPQVTSSIFCCMSMKFTVTDVTEM